MCRRRGAADRPRRGHARLARCRSAHRRRRRSRPGRTGVFGRQKGCHAKTRLFLEGGGGACRPVGAGLGRSAHRGGRSCRRRAAIGPSGADCRGGPGYCHACCAPGCRSARLGAGRHADRHAAEVGFAVPSALPSPRQRARPCALPTTSPAAPRRCGPRRRRCAPKVRARSSQNCSKRMPWSPRRSAAISRVGRRPGCSTGSKALALCANCQAAAPSGFMGCDDGGTGSTP